MSTYIDELGCELSVRELAIYDGSAGLSEEEREQYVRRWKAKGGKQSEPVVIELPVIDYTCPNRGEPTGEKVGCARCDRITLEVFACSLHGKCVKEERPKKDGVAACRWCSDLPSNAARTRKTPLVRVLGKHSSDGVTLVIPHRSTPDWLAVSHGLWRSLYPNLPILIVDNSPDSDEAAAFVRKMRAEFLTEVAWMAPKWGRVSPHEEVSTAMDYAFSRCETPLLLGVHSDMFPLRGDLIPMMAAKCTPEAPIVGWEMSRRPPNGPMPDMAVGVAGHVCTMYHIATMRRISAAWGIKRYVELSGDRRAHHGWPDVESGVSLAMQRAGLKPLLLGKETNGENQQTEWWLHCRSATIERARGKRRHIVGLRRGRELLASLQSSVRA